MKFRHECKHRINLADITRLRTRLEAVAERDPHSGEDGTNFVKSLYFDNYKDKVLREKTDGVNNREKFRIRYYGSDTSFIRLEKKTKIGGLCSKESTPITAEECRRIIDGDTEKAAEELIKAEAKKSLLRSKSVTKSGIELLGDTAVSGISNVSVTGSDVTILGGGVYVLSGELEGSVIVNAEGGAEVRLVLGGVNIVSPDYAAIYVEEAAKTVISLEPGTENHLTDGSVYSEEKLEDGKPSAALYSRDDLTVNGEGSLTVTGNYLDGIKVNDTLRITGGTIHVTAVDEGINVNDMIAVKNASIEINAGGDGLKCDSTDGSKGNISVRDTVLTAVSGGNGSIDVGDGGYVLAINGGSLIAAGASGMAEYPYSGSAQRSLVFYLEEPCAAGSEIMVTDSAGSEVLSGTSNKSFGFVCVSSEKITEGETYTLYINGTETASLTSSETVSLYGTASGGRGMGGRGMGGGPGGGAAPADAGTAAGESGAAGIADTMLGYVKEYITPIISVLMLAAAFVFVIFYKRKRY